jgi:signal transduction histidine kinase
LPRDNGGSSPVGIARKLIGFSNARDVLVCACRETMALARANAAFGTCWASGEPWERGLQLGTQAGPPGERPLDTRARSALYAVHRRLASTRPGAAAQCIDISGWDAVREGLATAGTPAQSLMAFRLPVPRGSLAAEIVLTSPHSDAFADLVTRHEIAELASLTGTVLESVHRLRLAKRDQERLHILAEASEEALWDWDLLSDQLWWGGGIHALLGGAEPSRRSKFGQLHPEDMASAKDSFDQALRSTQSSWRAEYRILRSDGASTLVEDRAYFLRAADGRAYRVIGAIRDVSTFKQLLDREQLARSEAEQANRTKDEFLAMLGHELRNPLAPIMMALQLMKAKADSSTARERRIIERQAQHLVRLVDDLLDVSRITRGVLELKVERIDCVTFVHQAIAMAMPLIEQRKHRLQLDVPQQGLPVDGDPARLAQVISNLLTNAARYTEPGGKIELSARALAGWVELTVRDSGIGITPEILPRVFDSFVQEQQGSDRSRGGLGLGLSIVKNLVTLHGGEVSAHSAGRGHGSRFVVRLPQPASTHASSAQDVALTPPSQRLDQRRILVVDDNRDAAELLAEYLAQSGHLIELAFDGPAALACADRFMPQLAILDIGLPEMDGYEVAARLRDRFGDTALRLIALTGYGQSTDRARALAAGFDEHLTKPVDVQQLGETVRRMTNA